MTIEWLKICGWAHIDSPFFRFIVLNVPCVSQSATSVKRQFDSVVPQGLSLIAEKLEELLNDYLSTLENAKQAKERGIHFAMEGIKPVNYIIITDGVPSECGVSHELVHILTSFAQLTTPNLLLFKLRSASMRGVSLSPKYVTCYVEAGRLF